MNVLSSVILVPTYKPPREFLEFVEELHRSFKNIVIVNDGSGREYQDIFNALGTMGIVLEQEKNTGKGSALKRGLRHIREHHRGRGVVTADSDGQHLIGDIISVAHSLEALGPKGLVLGEREFSKTKVPFCSMIGNSIVTAMIRRLFGHRVNDTQTGLRGIGEHLIDGLLNVAGERYEYETNALLYLLETEIPITPTPIKAVYTDKIHSHFHKLWDSYLISSAVIKRCMIGKKSRGIAHTIWPKR